MRSSHCGEPALRLALPTHVVGAGSGLNPKHSMWGMKEAGSPWIVWAVEMVLTT